MVQRRRLVYIVLFGQTAENDDEIPDTSIHGVFSSMKKAEGSIPEHNKEEISYFIIETALNEILDIQTEISEDEVQALLMEQMNLGLIDQLIDENGNFVYVLVDKDKEK